MNMINLKSRFYESIVELSPLVGCISSLTFFTYILTSIIVVFEWHQQNSYTINNHSVCCDRRFYSRISRKLFEYDLFLFIPLNLRLASMRSMAYCSYICISSLFAPLI